MRSAAKKCLLTVPLTVTGAGNINPVFHGLWFKHRMTPVTKKINKTHMYYLAIFEYNCSLKRIAI